MLVEFLTSIVGFLCRRSSSDRIRQIQGTVVSWIGCPGWLIAIFGIVLVLVNLFHPLEYLSIRVGWVALALGAVMFFGSFPINDAFDEVRRMK